jgi:AraC-like DNA-binding protein
VPRPSSSYRELPPPTALAPYVSCLWGQTIGAGDGAYEHPVLPDGCTDIVSINGDLMLVGPATRAVTEHLSPGSIVVGVRFRSGAAPPLLGVSATELRDREASMGDIWGRAGTTVAERCAGVPDGAEGPARLGLLVDALLRRLDDAPDLDPVATRAASVLADHPAPPVRDLARQADLSERQLRRRVEVAVGYPPRTLARILRFQRFLDAARSSPSPRRDLARLAAESGYADQAHLTRDSRQLAGLPPAALLDGEARRMAPAA